MKSDKLDRLCRSAGFAGVSALHTSLHRSADRLVRQNSLRRLYSGEDLAQDCWMKLLRDDWRLLRHLGTVSNPRAYIETMLRNLLCDLSRSLVRVRTLNGELWALHGPGNRVPPDSHWDQIAVVNALNRYVERECDDIDQAIFRSLILGDQPAENLATAVGVSRNSLYVRKHRMLRRLRGLVNRTRFVLALDGECR